MTRERSIAELLRYQFQQLRTAGPRQILGTGLGLALVRRFVELQKGRITVVSTLGEGSTFRVVLPVDVATALIAAEDESYPSR